MRVNIWLISFIKYIVTDNQTERLNFMKRILLSLLLLPVTASLAISASAYSSGILSPALKLLADKECMIRSALASGTITFTSADFERAVGCPIESITVTALPPSSDGTLYYGNSPVAVNQILSMASLSRLRFVPSKNCMSSSFRFKADNDYSIECLLKYTDSVNQTPVIASSEESVSVWTQQDITTFGTLSAYDPDGDALTFEIVRYPERGIIELTDPANGNYRYTPCIGIQGEDSFVYVVRDEWGNYSDEATVVIDIDEAAADLVFADMDGHWAHNAAIVMAADGAMDVDSRGGQLYFRPDEEITREDFLVTVMKALGAGDIEPCSTIFADDSAISTESSGYIARAYELGVIKGSEENGLLCFKPQESITRAEAAVILNAIIGADEPDILPVFADSQSVPAWAKGSIYALSNAGIFKGTGAGNISPNDVLSRAQTAQILLTVKNIYGE